MQANAPPPLPKHTSRQIAGAAAEQRALDLLQQQGLKLVTRNWHCKGGELDLVMRDTNTLVFVEVRSRQRRDYGGAAASVDRHKQQKLVLAARAFLKVHRQYQSLPARFDVVAFNGSEAPQWLRAAFDSVG